MQPAAMQESKARPKEEAGKKKRKKWGGGEPGGSQSETIDIFFSNGTFLSF